MSHIENPDTASVAMRPIVLLPTRFADAIAAVTNHRLAARAAASYSESNHRENISINRWIYWIAIAALLSCIIALNFVPFSWWWLLIWFGIFISFAVTQVAGRDMSQLYCQRQAAIAAEYRLGRDRLVIPELSGARFVEIQRGLLAVVWLESKRILVEETEYLPDAFPKEYFQSAPLSFCSGPKEQTIRIEIEDDAKDEVLSVRFEVNYTNDLDLDSSALPALQTIFSVPWLNPDPDTLLGLDEGIFRLAEDRLSALTDQAEWSTCGSGQRIGWLLTGLDEICDEINRTGLARLSYCLPEITTTARSPYHAGDEPIIA